jgi:hypothetical protein
MIFGNDTPGVMGSPDAASVGSPTANVGRPAHRGVTRRVSGAFRTKRPRLSRGLKCRLPHVGRATHDVHSRRCGQMHRRPEGRFSLGREAVSPKRCRPK